MGRRARGCPGAALSLLLLGLGAAGALEAQVTAVTGAGSRNCAQMQADIDALPNVRRAYVSWMQGYLSGRNAAREARGLALVDLADYESQWDWIAAWCEANPERAVSEAASALFDDRAGA